MSKKLSYFFDLWLFFDKQVDIFALAKKFKQTPDEIITNEQADDTNKTAKLFYISHSYDDYDLGEMFSEYVIKLKQDFPNLKQVLKENNGEGWVNIVFKQTGDCAMFFKQDTIDYLSELGLNIDICKD